jgi:surfactin synthase thioesterase subunit
MKINIYCLPFAGGSQQSYYQFTDHCGDDISFIALELPGRGTRWKEPPLKDIHAMTDDVFRQIKNELQQPYAIYGHSMGSLIGYLLIKKILTEQLPAPLHLFCSGAHEPTRPLVEKPRHLFSKEDFIKKLKQLGGSPDEVLDDPVMLEFYEPLLRADFQATDSYIHQASEPFNVPITVMIGTDEGITTEQALAWQQETTAPIEVIQFPGKHFFIFDHVADIIHIMKSNLYEKNNSRRRDTTAFADGNGYHQS